MALPSLRPLPFCCLIYIGIVLLHRVYLYREFVCLFALLVYQGSCTNDEFQMMTHFIADNYSDVEDLNDIADESEEITDDETFTDQFMFIVYCL